MIYKYYCADVKKSTDFMRVLIYLRSYDEYDNLGAIYR